jgi:hypothetical protein
LEFPDKEWLNSKHATLTRAKLIWREGGAWLCVLHNPYAPRLTPSALDLVNLNISNDRVEEEDP